MVIEGTRYGTRSTYHAGFCPKTFSFDLTPTLEQFQCNPHRLSEVELKETTGGEFSVYRASIRYS